MNDRVRRVRRFVRSSLDLVSIYLRHGLQRFFVQGVQLLHRDAFDAHRADELGEHARVRLDGGPLHGACEGERDWQDVGLAEEGKQNWNDVSLENLQQMLQFSRYAYVYYTNT